MIELSASKPDNFHEAWPGEYTFFSHYQYAAGVPHALFLITTLKGNGKPNVCFHSWSAFSGDSGGFFVIMPGLGQHTHTYKNILRDKEFCVNFVSAEYYDAAVETIEQNGDDMDEFAAGGFTPAPSSVVKPPRIGQAFLCHECRLESASDLSGKGITAMIVGRVVHAAVAEECRNIGTRCGRDGFMFYIHAPKEPATGKGMTSGVAVLDAVRLEEE